MSWLHHDKERRRIVVFGRELPYGPTPKDARSNEQKLIDAAILLLQKHGWTQGMTRRPDGSRCVYGAIVDAQRPEWPGAKNNVLDVIENDLLDGKIVTGWNDDDGRDVGEVFALLRTARERV